MRKIAELLGTFLLGTVSSLVATAVTAWYQGILKAQQQAGLHLDRFASFIAGLPTIVVLGFFALVFIALAIGLFIYVHRRTLPTETLNDPPAPPQGVPLGPIRSDAITKEQEKIVQEITPYAEVYRQTRDMMTRLLVFAAVVDNEIEEGASNGSTESWVRVTGRHATSFIEEIRPDLVQLRQRLSNGGEIDAALRDEAIDTDFFGPQAIRELAAGFSRILERLSAKIVEKASQL